MYYRKQIGNKGEQLACNYLIEKGYEVKEKNYNTPYGEIDIIAFKNNCYYFCEVKTRRNENFGKGYEAVGKSKIYKIQKVAEKYVMDLNWHGEVQVLVLSIRISKKNDVFIELIELFS